MLSGGVRPVWAWFGLGQVHIGLRVLPAWPPMRSSASAERSVAARRASRSYMSRRLDLAGVPRIHPGIGVADRGFARAEDVVDNGRSPTELP